MSIYGCSGHILVSVYVLYSRPPQQVSLTVFQKVKKLQLLICVEMSGRNSPNSRAEHVWRKMLRILFSQSKRTAFVSVDSSVGGKDSWPGAEQADFEMIESSLLSGKALNIVLGRSGGLDI